MSLNVSDFINTEYEQPYNSIASDAFLLDDNDMNW